MKHLRLWWVVLVIKSETILPIRLVTVAVIGYQPPNYDGLYTSVLLMSSSLLFG